jgi:hypothetical protein
MALSELEMPITRKSLDALALSLTCPSTLCDPDKIVRIYKTAWLLLSEKALPEYLSNNCGNKTKFIAEPLIDRYNDRNRLNNRPGARIFKPPMFPTACLIAQNHVPITPHSHRTSYHLQQNWTGDVLLAGGKTRPV